MKSSPQVLKGLAGERDRSKILWTPQPVDEDDRHDCRVTKGRALIAGMATLGDTFFAGKRIRCLDLASTS